MLMLRPRDRVRRRLEFCLEAAAASRKKPGRESTFLPMPQDFTITARSRGRFPCYYVGAMEGEASARAKRSGRIIEGSLRRLGIGLGFAHRSVRAQLNSQMLAEATGPVGQ